MKTTATEYPVSNPAVPRGVGVAILVIAASVIGACSTPAPKGPARGTEVQPRFETEALQLQGGPADVAVWTNQDNPAASLIMAGDNASGLHIYGSNGQSLHSSPIKGLSRIDPLGLDRSGDSARLLVGAINPVRDQLVVLAMDPTSGEVRSAPVDIEGLDFEPVAICATALVGGTSDAFVASESGTLARYTISVPRFGSGVEVQAAGQADIAPGITDCVADRMRRALWIAVKGSGIWQLPLRLDADSRPELVARVDARRLESVGGLAILRARGEAMLLASSPADGSFSAFELGSGRFQGGITRITEGSRWHGRFHIVASNGIDDVTGNYGLGAGGGMLVVRDGRDEPGGGQNFKIVAIDEVRDALDNQ